MTRQEAERLDPPPAGPDQAAYQPAPVRGGPYAWARLAFLLAVLIFAALFVAERWDSLGPALGRLSWVTVMGSLALGLVGTLLGLVAWREVLTDLGVALGLRPAGRVFLLGQMGKYVPGSVWTVIAQAELARELQIPRRTAVAAALLTILVSLAVGLGVAAIFLPFTEPEAARRYWWVVFFIPVLVMALHPRVVVTGVNLMLRLQRRGELQAQPSSRGLLRAGAWQAASWVTLGLHAWVLVIGMGGAAGASLPVAIGGFALAFCLGVLVVPVPAGAGVRDVALVVALGGVISSDEALAVALVSRVLLTATDFSLGGAWWWATRASRGREIR